MKRQQHVDLRYNLWAPPMEAAHPLILKINIVSDRNITKGH